MAAAAQPCREDELTPSTTPSTARTTTLLRPGASRTAALATLLAMQLMIILDGTIVTVALPAIQTDLGFSASGLAWVLNAFLIAFAGLLLLAGRLGDLLGSIRVFRAGLLVFTAASLLCGLATTPLLLVAGRFGQGVGGALASAVILGMVVRLYPSRGEQARAIGTYSFVSAAGASLGFILGGVLTDTLGWQANFLVNVPIGLVVLVVSARMFNTDRGAGAGSADLLGGLLATVSLSLGVLAIVRIAEVGWTSAQTLVTGVAATVVMAGFVWRQATAATPLLPLRLFRSRQVSVANGVVVLVFAAAFGFQFTTALYLQRVLGFDPLQTGLAFLPTAVLIGAVSMGASARLTVRFGVRPVLLVGIAGFAVSLILVSRLGVGADYLSEVFPLFVLMGAATGLVIPALMLLAMSGADPDDAGVASGLVNTTQQAGAAVGLAVLATVASGRTSGSLEDGAAGLEALQAGYSLAFLIAAGFLLVALLVAATLLPRHRPTP